MIKLSKESPGHEAALAYKANPTVENKEHVFQSCKGLLINEVKRFIGLDIYDDLVGVANEGLMTALNVFDPDTAKFTTIATYYIRGRLKNHLRDTIELIKRPTWHYEYLPKYEKKFKALEQQLGRPPNVREMAAALKCRIATILTIQKQLENKFTYISVDDTNGTDDNDNRESLVKELWGGPKGGAFVSVPSRGQEEFDEIMALLKQDVDVTLLSEITGLSKDKCRQIKMAFDEYCEADSS